MPNEPSQDVRAYLANLGRKGGSAKGACKRRPPEHYAEMVKIRLQKKVMQDLVSKGIVCIEESAPITKKAWDSLRETPKKGEK